ncbi:MAG: hypothetical protein IJF11_02045 [Clostridia bacterium]|nr:hypothetical protein [Clostridia bacterium]
MNNESKCPICGEPTFLVYGKYPRKDGLCKECSQKLFNNEIIQCINCGKWHNTEEICECFKAPKTNASESNEITCIICGKDSKGKHFCINCYHEYKDKSIDIRITNCKEVEILDKYGNLTIECDDGRRVRSRAEALISNFLYNNKIRSVYEKTIYYEENGESKTLHPDFYLPDYELYIEYNEIKKKGYLKSKEYTKSIYEKLNLKVLIMDDKDLNSIAGCLKPILKIN